MSIEITINLRCNKCNANLTGTDYATGHIDIDPCTDCLAAEHKKAYDEGYEKGVEDASEPD